MEIIFLLIAGLGVGVSLAYGYEKLPLRKIFKRKSLIIKGYKLHHSLYGIALIIFTFFLNINPTLAILMISTGVGILFQHYLTSGTFDLITKEKHK